MSVSTGIIKVLGKRLSELGDCELKALQLSLGELSGIDRESLSFALETLLADEGYNGVDIFFEFSPATFQCSACNWRGRLKGFALVCPECEGRDLDIIAGQDVTLERIEVE